MKKLRVVFTLLVLLFLGFAVYLMLVPPEDQRSIQYTLWKDDLFPFRTAFETAFYVDHQARELVLGRSESYIRRKFSPLNEGKRNEQYWGQVYNQFLPTDRFLWLWQTNYLVVIRDNRVIYFNLVKG